MKKAAAVKGLTHIRQRRSVSEKILLPRDILFDFAVQFCRLLCTLALSDSFRLIIVCIADHREEDHQVPVIALAVPHPEWSFISSFFHCGGARFVEINQFHELSWSGLHQAYLVQVRRVRGERRQSKSGDEQKDQHTFTH